ncbi:DUF3761 domain-containing protein [Amycolatopsis sp. cg5]|uniref:DUF3761 domain-containing protein n=1 Tax=Amycolatopsis sp. cg5 TaxID=3238802 RepID=UPI003525630F
MRHAFLKTASGLVLGFAVLTGCGAVATPATVLTTTTSTPETSTYPLQTAPASTTTSAPVVSTTTSTSAPAVQPFVPQAPTPAPKATSAKKAAAAECGGDYYRNVDGNCVHRPGGSPAGASAKCKDGTYSYSQNRRGTCSGHGGVATWL